MEGAKAGMDGYMSSDLGSQQKKHKKWITSHRVSKRGDNETIENVASITYLRSVIA